MAQDISTYDSQLKIEAGRITGSTSNVQKDVNSFLSLSQISDPVSIGFKIFFRYDSQFGLLAPESSPNSALSYLKRIGDDTRMALLKKFINHLQFLNIEMSYVFQNIDGLDIIRQHKPWERYGEDAKITITTLETVDFKVQSLMSLYKDIWYDSLRGVEILPVNLRRFDCSVFVYALGAYQIIETENKIDEYAYMSIPNAKRQYDNQSTGVSTLSNVNEMYCVKAPDLYNHIVYDLSECEFLPWESQEGMHKPSNNSVETITNTISFSFRWCRDAWRLFGLTGNNQFSASALMAIAVAKDKDTKLSVMDKFNDFKSSLFGDSFFGNLAENVFDTAMAPLTSRAEAILDKYGSLEKIKERGLNAAKDLATNAANSLANKIAGKLEGMFLGNVYNVSASSVIGALTGDNLASGLTSLAGRATGSSESLKSEKKLQQGTNVYGKM